MSIGMAGWNSTSRFTMMGATRALTQLFSYEAPFMLALLGPAVVAGSWQISEIVRPTRDSGSSSPSRSASWWP